MKPTNNRTQSNSRARDKSNKRVRANNKNTRSAKRPNTTLRSVESFSRSTFTCSPLTSVPLKDCESTDEVRFAVKKTAAGKQSVEVRKNVPIIESTFFRFSSETRHVLRCHVEEELTADMCEVYDALDYTPCDVVRECSECKYFHEEFFDILKFKQL